MSNHIMGSHHTSAYLVIIHLLLALFPHNWSIMWASSSTLPAVSTATKTFPPPLQTVKIEQSRTSKSLHHFFVVFCGNQIK